MAATTNDTHSNPFQNHSLRPCPKSNGFLLHFIILLLFLSISSSSSSSTTTSLVHEHRPDPLSLFKSYNGDFNISNRHYWASAAFTGVHGYAMAGIWILGGLGFGFFIILKNHHGRFPAIRDHSASYFLIPFFLIVFFTFLAIVASGFILAANKNFVWRAKKLEQTVLGTAGDARRTIKKVAKAMQEMQHMLLPYKDPISSRLNATSQRLETESENIQRIVYKNRRSIDLAIRFSSIATVVVATISIVFVVAALALLLLHWRPGIIMIIFLCWILTTVCWVLTGFHFFVHTFADDTCSAFMEFERNPVNNSLSSVLPCVNQVSGDHIMIEIGSTVHKFIHKLNSKLSMIDRFLGLTDQNEDVLNNAFSKICDPFSGAPNFTYNPSECAKDAIPIGDIPNVLARFTCYKDNSTLSCEGGQKFISEYSYDMASAYTRTIQNMLNVIPDLRKLTQCSFVKDTFANVHLTHCRPFRVSIEVLWASTLSLSIVMVILEILWVTKLWQERGRMFSWCSLIPKSITTQIETS